MLLNNFSRFFLVTTALACSQLVLANERQWYFVPGLQYIIADSDRVADDGPGLSLGLGKRVGDKWSIEASLMMDELDFENTAGEYDQKGLMLDALYLYNGTMKSTPYAVIGLGALRTDIGSGANTNFAANVGVGYMKSFSDSGMGLRGDIRYRLDEDDKSVAGQNRFSDWVVGISLVIPFGKSQQVAVAPAPAPAAPVRVAEPVKEVPKVKDSDNDGVIDANDRCPDTLSNVKVDKYGCEIIALKGVHFETNSAKLTSSSLMILDTAANTLKKRGDIKVQVAGHTDSMGSAAYNQQLSAKRAETVRQYLVNKGVNSNNLSARGYGEGEPVASNSNAAGRAENRRVELRLLN